VILFVTQEIYRIACKHFVKITISIYLIQTWPDDQPFANWQLTGHHCRCLSPASLS
jgi:hypothetical protein